MSLILGWNLSSRETLWGFQSATWLPLVVTMWELHGTSPSIQKHAAVPTDLRGKVSLLPYSPPSLLCCLSVCLLTAHRGRDKRLWDKNAPGWTGTKESVGKNHSSGGPTLRNCLGYTVPQGTWHCSKGMAICCTPKASLCPRTVTFPLKINKMFWSCIWRLPVHFVSRMRILC